MNKNWMRLCREGDDGYSRRYFPATAFGLLCFAMGFAGPAAAQQGGGFYYKYVQAAYIFGEYDFADVDVDVKGYELTAQFEMTPSLILGISYSSLEGDDTVTNAGGSQTLTFDGSGPDVYAFYHSPLGAQTEFLIGARVDMSQFEGAVRGQEPSIEQSEDENLLFAGLRYRLNALEFEAQWDYNLDAENNEDEWSYTLGLVSGVPGSLQLGFKIAPDDRGDLMGVFLRQAY
ncbi:MAG: outer membrane beta-barrel protein [Granulosicoccus sp.]